MLREMNKKVKLCDKQGSEGHERLHAIKRSQRGHMISYFRVQIRASKLTMQAMI